MTALDDLRENIRKGIDQLRKRVDGWTSHAGCYYRCDDACDNHFDYSGAFKVRFTYSINRDVLICSAQPSTAKPYSRRLKYEMPLNDIDTPGEFELTMREKGFAEATELAELYARLIQLPGLFPGLFHRPPTEE